MAHVDIFLSGRKYSVSCEAGQEPRLRELADYVGGRLRELTDSGVTGSDAHMLALTTLLIADELFDITDQVKAARSGLSREPDRNSTTAATIDTLTRRIEDLAVRLERP
ncbi:MAG: cell division protein ZapA [Rhodospirillaceae bacterium]